MGTQLHTVFVVEDDELTRTSLVTATVSTSFAIEQAALEVLGAVRNLTAAE